LELYLKANAIEGYATDLSKPLLMPLSDLPSTFWPSCAKSRGEIMASAVDNYLGEALGQLYVKNISQKAQKNMLDLVNNVQKAYAIRIDKLEWMSDSTKEKKEKKTATTKKIGYQINGRTTAPLLFQETRILKTWYQLQEMHTSVN
jgi:putative endopeptidase